MHAVSVQVVRVVQETTSWWQVLLSGLIGTLVAGLLTVWVAFIVLRRQLGTNRDLLRAQLRAERQAERRLLKANWELAQEQRRLDDIATAVTALTEIHQRLTASVQAKPSQQQTRDMITTYEWFDTRRMDDYRATRRVNSDIAEELFATNKRDISWTPDLIAEATNGALAILETMIGELESEIRSPKEGVIRITPWDIEEQEERLAVEREREEEQAHRFGRVRQWLWNVFRPTP